MTFQAYLRPRPNEALGDVGIQRGEAAGFYVKMVTVGAGDPQFFELFEMIPVREFDSSTLGRSNVRHA